MILRSGIVSLEGDETVEAVGELKTGLTLEIRKEDDYEGERSVYGRRNAPSSTVAPVDSWVVRGIGVKPPGA